MALEKSGGRAVLRDRPTAPLPFLYPACSGITLTQRQSPRAGKRNPQGQWPRRARRNDAESIGVAQRERLDQELLVHGNADPLRQSQVLAIGADQQMLAIVERISAIVERQLDP